MDENLYRCLKQVQAAFQGATFTIPQRESDAYKAMKIPYCEEWKLGQLIDALLWAEKKSAEAATAVYMVGKD